MHVPAPGLPRLGLLLGDTAPETVRPLLLEVGDRVRPVDGAHDADGTVPRAYLWAGDPEHPPAGSPYAVWLRTVDDAEHELVAAAAALITADAEVADATGALFVPDRTLVPHARPILPAIRRRLRTQRGLPTRVVAAGEYTSWLWIPISSRGEMRAMPLARALADTAAATAGAVAAVGRALPTALAWAAPTVTDLASAQAWSALPGRDVLVAESYEQRLVLAKDLAADERRASALGWSGRLLMQNRHDLRSTARSLLAALRLPAGSVGGQLAGSAVWRDTLDSMHMPAEAPARWRVASLMRSLPTSMVSGLDLGEG